ncbi:MAG: YqiJ family protein [bacterium]|nr:YqiJ family protein [bacterium]
MFELQATAATDLLTGANIPFLASFLLAALMTLLSVLGLGHTDAEADVDADVDHDVDLDVDHDVDLDVDHDIDLDVDHDIDVGLDHDVDLDVDHDIDVDVDHDVDLDHDVDVDHDADVHLDHTAEAAATSGVSLDDILYFFGIGRVPLSILLMSFGYAFGVVGWLLNTVLAGADGDVGPLFSASLGGAMVAGLLSMRLVSSTIGRVLPTQNVSGFSRRQLVGLRGTVGLPVDEQGGRVTVTDAEGTFHQLRCRSVPGGKPLPKGTKVIIVKYLAEDDLFYVAPDRRRP